MKTILSYHHHYHHLSYLATIPLLLVLLTQHTFGSGGIGNKISKRFVLNGIEPLTTGTRGKNRSPRSQFLYWKGRLWRWPAKFTKKTNYECFRIYWNVPSQVCNAKADTSLPLASYGIRSNRDQSFFGDQINIIYDNQELVWPHVNPDGTEVNGGIPQRGNLPLHLSTFATVVNTKIPDQAFEGLAVIDFEEFTPLWKTLWGSQTIYKNLSLEYAKNFLGLQDESGYSDVVQKYAQSSFENAARMFLEQTLILGKNMRPYAKWGYYGFPTCSKSQFDIEGCPYLEQVDNDKLMWLYQASNALYPSIYLYKSSFVDESHYALWLYKMFRETSRVAQLVNAQRKERYQPLLEVYPYFRYEYSDNAVSNTQFLTSKDMRSSILGAKLFGFNGIVIWDSSNGISKQCTSIQNLLQSYLGPLLLSASVC